MAKATAPDSITPVALASLRRWNRWLAALHVLQGVAILVLSTRREFPITTSYLTPDPVASSVSGHAVLGVASRQLFSVNVGYAIAVFFFLSALAHGLLATVYRNRYEADVKRGVNRLRWFEYALSASTMMVAIGLLSGVYDLATLITLFVLTAIMNLLGLAMEIYNQGRGRPNWLAYWIGCLAGLAPWLVVALYLYGASVYGASSIPTFVLWIYGTMFVAFGSFAVNMFLQYKKKGRWSQYVYGERVYMILSLVAKTALAWQVFAGTLRP